MSRYLLVTLTAAALLAQTPPKTAAPSDKKASALDKPALEAYLRHLFVWPAPIQITISNPQPAPMPGFYEVKVQGTSGNQNQQETFYVSHDGQKIVRGVVYDINQNPFKGDLDKIRTDLQPGFGTPGATVVIAEFSDFECPYCRELAKTLRDNLVKTYPAEVRAYFFDFPLEQIHPWAKSAAIAGRCVFRQSASAYWDYHDWAFENQSSITADNFKVKLVEFAKTKDKDVDVAQLMACVDSRATDAEVEKTKALGQSLAVNQTPTIFINGRRLAGSTAWNDLKFIIDYEIGYQKIAKNAGEDCGCDIRLPTFGGDTPGAGKPASAPATLHK